MMDIRIYLSFGVGETVHCRVLALIVPRKLIFEIEKLKGGHVFLVMLLVIFVGGPNKSFTER